MHNTNSLKVKILAWLIPPISEVEFIFFVSLLFSTLILQVLSNIHVLTELWSSSDSAFGPKNMLGIAVIVLLFIYPLPKLAYKAVKSNKAPDITYRRRFVIIPPICLLYIWVAS